jgi:DNA-binding CsgD family transcriptional regulator
VRAALEAPAFDELSRVFTAGFGRLLGVPMYGFYALDEEAPRIRHNVAVNVSDLFVARYERAMDADPLLRQSRATGKPVYNRDLMTGPEWEASEIYRRAYSTHAMRHVAEIPITDEAKVIGALHFGASKRERWFVARDMRLAGAVARVLATSIRRIRARGRTERELELTQAALDLAGTAVVISEPREPELRMNAAAHRVVGEVRDADERLYELLAGTPDGGRRSRRAEVELTDGAPGLLHAHSDRMPEGALVTILELQRAQPRLDRRLLSGLTTREAQVATLVVEGLSDREIADALALSHHTVSQHVKSVYAKLGTDSRVGLTRLLLGAPPTVRRS